MSTWNRRDILRTSTLAALGSALPIGAMQQTPDSKKKGLCITTKTPHWARRLADLKPHWFYSWGSSIPEGIPAGVDFIPMIWGYWGNDESIAKAGADAKAAGIDTLLGFNEPDEHRQANMSVEKALKAWPLLEKTGLRLGSPGCVHPDDEWMKTFMAETRKRELRVDFVTVHSYGGANPEALIKRLESIHRMYKKPIWITEFAVGDWDAKSPEKNRHRPEAVLRFMEKTLPRLEGMDFIERYSWFPAGQDNNALGTSALYDKAGKLTRLGEFYRDF